ncbi:MAG: YpdA family putative bacillithiol disulfide reductase [Longimicrobiales bacterium]
MESAREDIQDIAVVGAGPCGLGAGIAAHAAGLQCVLFDKGCAASSIAAYPTFMTFFSTAERLEIGGVPFIVAGEKPTRREALRYYQRLATQFELDLRQYEEVTAVERAAGGFVLATLARSGKQGTYRARNIVIATGYFDHPNRLGIPGEELPHVLHNYREGHAFYRQRCVLVGGGNSAVDAALELYRWGARVMLVHFEAGLDRGVKPWVLPDITNRIAAGQIEARFRSRLAEIRPESVVLRDEDSGALEEIGNDWVLAMTGYTPDPELLKALGVDFDAATGIPAHDRETMETNVPGVFIAGVLAAGNDANKVFIENGREHGDRIVGAVALRRRLGTRPRATAASAVERSSSR